MRHLFLIAVILTATSLSAAQTKNPRPQSTRSKPGSEASSNPKELTPRQVASLIYPAMVSVYGINSEDDISTGTGFVVAPGVVATCHHVVENARGIVATPLNDLKEKHLAKVLRFDAGRDITLLQVDKFKLAPLKLFSGSDLYVGETIYTVGNPKGLKGSFSNGVISNFHQTDTDTYLIQFTAPVSPGNSGGPVVNSAGKVIGIVDSQITGGQNLNFAVSSMHLSMLMLGRTDVPDGTYMDGNLGPPPKKRP